MNEELIDQIVAEVKKRQNLPAALLIGQKPAQELGFQYILEGEHSAVVIGSMDASDVLHFPNGECAQALLMGKPVYLWQDGLRYRAFSRTANRALWSKLLSAERQMKQLGVQFIGAKQQKLLTADEVRRRLRDGQSIDGRLTPLARDVLEGKL